MNKKFLNLPYEKQQKIIDAGFKVFSENSYKKSPMSEIAQTAGISKSLLFYYFHNKKELYIFLWDKAASITMQHLDEEHCYEPTNLFEMMQRGMHAKFKIIELYPYMATFTIKAFYEKDPEISAEIQQSYHEHFNLKAANALSALNPKDYIPGLDFKMMYREMYLASLGYLWEVLQCGPINVEKLEKDFIQMMQFWKTIYLNREGNI